METKICKGCGKELSMDCYCKSSNTDGKENKCKGCRNEKAKQNYIKGKAHKIEYTKQYVKVNAEKIKKQKQQYYIENKEAINKRNEQWQKNNSEYRNEKSKQYYIDNLGRITERQKNHYLINREKMLARCRKYERLNLPKQVIKAQKRRALKKSLPATLTIEQWESIKLNFNNKCAYCGQEKPLAQEHVTPLIKGGEYTINNIIPSCKSCNSSKGIKDFFGWYPKHKHYSKKREKIILEFLNYKDGNQQLKII